MQRAAPWQTGRSRPSRPITLVGPKEKTPLSVPLTDTLLIPLALNALIWTEIGVGQLTVQVIRNLYPLVSLVVITRPVI